MPLNRRTLLTGIGGATALTIAGCLGSDRGTTLWNDFESAEEDDLEDHLERFNDDRDEEMHAENISEMGEQLDTALPAGDGPETFAWAHDWLGRYHEQEFVHDATDDLEVDLASTYTESAIEAVQWEDGTYGLPYASETVSLMYNPDLVDEPPETLSEMVDVMGDYHDPSDNQYGLSCPAIDPYFVSAYLHAFGGYIFDEESGALGVESDEFVEGVELVDDALWSYVPADPAYDSQITVFNDGNAPFAINGPWQLDGFRDAGVDATVAPLPEVDGGDPMPLTGVQTWYFTSELEEAEDDALETTVDWAEWYTTDEDVIVRNAQNHGLIPVHQEYVDNDDLGDDVETFTETVEMGRPIPADPRMDYVWTPLEEGLERVFHGDESAADAMEATAEEIRGRWD